MAGPIIKSLGIRYSLVVGSATYVVFVASFIAPSQWTILSGAFILGFGASVLWIAQG